MAKEYKGTNVASCYQTSSVVDDSPKASEINNHIKQNVSSTKRIPSTLPIVSADEHTIVCGISAMSGQLQGFEMQNTANVFIGINAEAYPTRLLERVLGLSNAVFFDIFSPDEPKGEFVTSVNSEADIHAMLQNIVCEVNDRESELQMLTAANIENDEIYGYMQKYKRIFLLIRNFSKFYDEISDDDLKLLLTILRKKQNLGIYIITVADLESIVPYCDTALYIELIKTEKGVILGGNISDKQAVGLGAQFSEIPVSERKKKLSSNSAFMYSNTKYSIIEIN